MAATALAACARGEFSPPGHQDGDTGSTIGDATDHTDTPETDGTHDTSGRPSSTTRGNGDTGPTGPGDGDTSDSPISTGDSPISTGDSPISTGGGTETGDDGTSTEIPDEPAIGLELAGEPPANPHLADSPWPHAHRSGLNQASSPHPGLTTSSASIHVINYLEEIEETRQFGGSAVPQVSPWLALSSRRYTDAPGSRALWAVSLTDIWKLETSDDGLQFVSNAQFRDNDQSIPWNFMVLADDSVLVPNPLGTIRVDAPACRSFAPSLLRFRDGSTIDSPVECVERFSFTDAVLEACTGPDGAPPTTERAYSVTFTGLTHQGDVIVDIQFLAENAQEENHLYLAIVDADLTELRTCRHVADAPPSSQFAVEPEGENATAIYAATSRGLIKLVHDAIENTLEERWVRDLGLRHGTSTAPTLVGFLEDRFVVVTDSPCGISDGFRGPIACAPGDESARLVAVRRDDDRDDIHVIDLPDAIRTLENSPAAWGFVLVVAEYAGVQPNPGRRGVVAIQWNPDTEAFEELWFNPDVQMNGTPALSGGSNLVFGSGLSAEGDVHLHGLRVIDDDDGPGGEVVIDVIVAPAAEAAAAVDTGNSTIIGSDGSLTWATSSGLVRLTPDP